MKPAGGLVWHDIDFNLINSGSLHECVNHKIPFIEMILKQIYENSALQSTREKAFRVLKDYLHQR